MGSVELTHEALVLEMNDLVEEGVLQVVPPPPFVTERDAFAMSAFVFMNQLMQREVLQHPSPFSPGQGGRPATHPSTPRRGWLLADGPPPLCGRRR